ncbi:MAG: polyphosphate kinase [Cyclobacteriaceae bacterium]|nr:MAG: polyphosphate kinase [Cyclobacteriaceae bacterium]
MLVQDKNVSRFFGGAFKANSYVEKSDYVSRDLSWLNFNNRVLDQAKKKNRSLFERMKFMAITASNLDEFFMIRVGSLYNYLDYGRRRIDYSGLREVPFREKLLKESKAFFQSVNDYYSNELKPLFDSNGFRIKKVDELTEEHKTTVRKYFEKTIYPMLTPMAYDSYHTFPVLMNNVATFGVVTKSPGDMIAVGKREKFNRKISFVQIPPNLPKFYEIMDNDHLIFVPIEDIVGKYMEWLFRNVDIQGMCLFRLTRNGDFSVEESDDIEANFLEEMKRKLKTRKTGRVVRIEMSASSNKWVLRLLKSRWDLDENNIFWVPDESIFDFTRFWQIVGHRHFNDRVPAPPEPIKPLSYPELDTSDIFEVLKSKDILLHSPYNSIEPLIHLIEKASEDPDVLLIKLTVYRLAKESRIIKALNNAAENGKHVSVLFEVKARFDEENNMKQAQLLQKAGCFVIYGISRYKTHTKLLLIVRKQGRQITSYVHMGSGNYNEDTSKIYSDIGIMSTNEVYAQDVSEFFNVITGHSSPKSYQRLITAPTEMRNKLIDLLAVESQNARKGRPSGVVIKINSIQDQEVIDALYEASQQGVPIKLIVRGICCLRPGRIGLSDNIEVYSIVGNYLEHSRIYYFHNNNDPKVYGGSADIMVRSFDRRLESLFLISDERLKQEAINILAYCLKDNHNSYTMLEDGRYVVKQADGEPKFNIHQEFFKVTPEEVMSAKLF